MRRTEISCASPSLVKRVALFAKLSGSELTFVAEASRVHRYPAKHVIWRQGDAADSLHAVLAGYVKGERVSVAGAGLMLCVTGPGEVFGELSAFEDRPRVATMTTLEPTEILVLGRESLHQLVAKSPTFANELVQFMASRLRELSSRCEAASHLQMSAKMAEALLRLSRRFGACEGNAVRIQPRLSQQELANFVGLARESVNKILRQWIRSGVVRYENRRLSIADVAALERHSESAPGSVAAE